MLTANKGFMVCLLALLATLFSCRSKEPAPPVLTPQLNQSPVPPPKKTEKAPMAGVDKSAMDMSYFPVDYPVLKMSGKTADLPVARVIYSRPFKDGREIFGNLIKYGSHWRLGANEASEIEFFIPVKIKGQPIKKGRYVIYCIPHKDTWTVVFNSDLYTWGLKINASKDVCSFDIPAKTVPYIYEALTLEFEKADDGCQLVMAWDNIQAILPIAF